MDHDAHSQLLEKVRNYHTPPEAVALLANNPPLIIAGITASGKNSAVKYITGISNYRQVITHTTRPPRSGEQNGVDYWFITEKQMLELLKEHKMIEANVLHEQQVSGVSVAAYRLLITAGYRPLLIVDVQGVEAISKYLPRSIRPYFLLPPSFDTWMNWLEKRGQMSHTERLRRMTSARSELEKSLRTDIFMLIVNHEIPLTADEILRGVQDIPIQHKNREIAHQLLERLKTI